MKKLILAAAAFTIVALTHSANAQAASATASATATVVAPIAISKTADLRFGSLSASAAPGTVVMTTAGVRSATGGATLVTDGASTGAAAFNVTGAPNATYSITLPASTTITSGGNNMTVNTFASNPTPTGLLSGAGAQALLVGATLQVGATQAQGAYTGTFNVTVNYN